MRSSVQPHKEKGDSGRMKLLFKQRYFSWFDRYDIYNEAGQTVYTVKGEPSWGHLLRVYDAKGKAIAAVKEKVLSFQPKFEMYLGNDYIGSISKAFSFFAPKFNIDYNGWQIDGDFFEWDYSIHNAARGRIATVSKELWKLNDFYVIDVNDPQDALCALMLVLAIDAEKCSRRK